MRQVAVLIMLIPLVLSYGLSPRIGGLAVERHFLSISGTLQAARCRMEALPPNPCLPENSPPMLGKF